MQNPDTQGRHMGHPGLPLPTPLSDQQQILMLLQNQQQSGGHPQQQVEQFIHQMLLPTQEKETSNTHQEESQEAKTASPEFTEKPLDTLLQAFQREEK